MKIEPKAKSDDVPTIPTFVPQELRKLRDVLDEEKAELDRTDMDPETKKRKKAQLNWSVAATEWPIKNMPSF